MKMFMMRMVMMMVCTFFFEVVPTREKKRRRRRPSLSTMYLIREPVNKGGKIQKQKNEERAIYDVK